jgi:hypothetical protein
VGSEIKSFPTDKQGESMEKLDKERYLKRVIVVCWIALAICFGIKLFGGNLFEIICENENFIKVCEYADSHLWAYYLICVFVSLPNTYFFILAMISKVKYNKYQTIIVIATVLLNVAVKMFSNIGGVILDVWQVIIMPAIFTLDNKKTHYKIIIGNILLMIFQLISMYIKNINTILVTNDGALISFIFSIDVFLMILLYYSYANIKKGG